MTRFLYHGTATDRIASILEEGLAGPSYWGTVDEAARYASDDGLLFVVPVDVFEPDLLAFNDLLAASLAQDGDDVPTEGDWEASLEEFGSVRYDGTLFVEARHLVRLVDVLGNARPSP